MSLESVQIPFHLAFPVKDIASTRYFYGTFLQCEIGREAERWIDFNFFGHQLSAHVVEDQITQVAVNEVDQHAVPARHFGCVLPCLAWGQLVERCQQYDIRFYISPYTRFEGVMGEQQTFFIQDPSGNFLEFKCFKHYQSLFEKVE